MNKKSYQCVYLNNSYTGVEVIWAIPNISILQMVLHLNYWLSSTAKTSNAFSKCCKWEVIYMQADA